MRPLTKITIFGVRLAIALLAAYWLGIFIGTHVPDVMLDITPGAQVNDKTKHFTAFFVLGFLMCYTTTSTNWLRRFLGIGLVGMAYAALDEMTQRFVPGRYPDVMDFVADSAGLWTAIGLYVLAKYCYRYLYPSATAPENGQS